MIIDSGAGGLLRSSWILTVGKVAWVVALIWSVHFYSVAPSRVTAIVASHVAAERRAVALSQRELLASLMRGALGSTESAIQLRRQSPTGAVSAHNAAPATLVSPVSLATDARIRLATVKGAIYNLAGQDDDDMFPDDLMRAVNRLDLSMASAEGLFEGASASGAGRPDIERVWLSAQSVDAAAARLAAWSVSAAPPFDNRNPPDHSPETMLGSFLRDFVITGLGCAYLALFPAALPFRRRSP